MTPDPEVGDFQTTRAGSSVASYQSPGRLSVVDVLSDPLLKEIVRVGVEVFVRPTLERALRTSRAGAEFFTGVVGPVLDRIVKLCAFTPSYGSPGLEKTHRTRETFETVFGSGLLEGWSYKFSGAGPPPPLFLASSGANPFLEVAA